MPNNPPAYRSGEHPMPEGASEDVKVLAATVQLGFRSLGERLEDIAAQNEHRSDKIDTRLEQGTATMAQLSTTLVRVTSTLETHSAIIEKLQYKNPDRTPRATPALIPNAEPPKDKDKIPWWAREAIRAAITVVVTGLVIILLGHGPMIAKAFAGSAVSP